MSRCLVPYDIIQHPFSSCDTFSKQCTLTDVWPSGSQDHGFFNPRWFGALCYWVKHIISRYSAITTTTDTWYSAFLHTTLIWWREWNNVQQKHLIFIIESFGVVVEHSYLIFDRKINHHYLFICFATNERIRVIYFLDCLCPMRYKFCLFINV